MSEDKFLESDDDVQEILRLAIRQSHETTEDLRSRLTSTAEELGISAESLQKAEREYKGRKNIERDLREYDDSRRRALKGHLVSYLVVNLGLFLINLMTDGPGKLWCLFPLIGWGIGMAIHAGTVLMVRPDIRDEGFREWKRSHARAKKNLKKYDDDDDDDD